MGKLYERIEPHIQSFVEAQKMFFVATAPTHGHVNVSPKGRDSFRVLGPTTVAYWDFNGSGVETIAHLRENGRITVMFNAFDGPPKIVRFYGKGEVIEPGSSAYQELLPLFPALPGARALIRVEVDRITDSCGYGVPLYEYVGERTQLEAWAEKKGEEGIRAYQRQKNAESIDGLPGLPWLDSAE